MNTTKITKTLTLVNIIALIVSCEGYKPFTFHNNSDSYVKVVVKPGLDSTDFRKFPNNKMFQYLDSTVVILEADSSFIIYSHFTSLLFKPKFKEKDLRMDYLRIESKNDTVIAHSKQEILDLVYLNKKGKIRGDSLNYTTILIDN